MNSEGWKNLNEKFGSEYGSFRAAKTRGDLISDVQRVSGLVSDALKIAGLLYRPGSRNKLRPMYKYEANGNDMPYGLAPAVLADLPDPESFSPESSAYFYFELVRAALDNRVPGDLFLQAYNYANRLLPRFQETRYFTNLEAYEHLERKLRKRLITNECANLVISSMMPKM